MTKEKNANHYQLAPPSTSGKWFYITLLVTFLGSFCLYLATLAPSVTFEDSGELIAAAYRLGIPHEPGYPLYVLLGKLFSWLPIGSVAYRLNLMSAFFAALSNTFIAYAALLVFGKIAAGTNQTLYSSSKHPHRLAYLTAIATAGLFAVSFEHWEQAIITEVYGLNSFFFAVVFTVLLLWDRERNAAMGNRYFFLLMLLLGLSLCNHHSALMLFPMVAVFMVLTDYRFLLQPRRLAAGFAFLLGGLAPYLYLPLASARNPVIDWGNPENGTNFWQTVMRHQYQENKDEVGGSFSSDLGYFFSELLTDQWWFVVPVLAVVGLWVLFRNSKTWFGAMVTFLVFSVFIMTQIAGFDVAKTGTMEAISKSIFSVAYIPAYMAIALLAGTAIFAIAHKWNTLPTLTLSLPGLALVLVMAQGAANYGKVNMRDYTFADTYSNGLLKVATPNALVLTNWDAYYFPLNYHQYVEGQRPDVTVIDIPLLKRTWYVQWLRQHHPELAQAAQADITGFLAAVAPFEAGEEYNGPLIQQHYIGMINTIVDHTLQSQHDVFFTFVPEKAIIRNLDARSVLIAFRVNGTDPKNPNADLDVDLKSLGLEEFNTPLAKRDPIATFFRQYYAQTIALRAVGKAYHKTNPDPEAGLALFKEALKYVEPDTREYNGIRQQINALSDQLNTR